MAAAQKIFWLVMVLLLAVLVIIAAYVSITGLFGIQWFWDRFFYTASLVQFTVFGAPASVDKMIDTADYWLAFSTKNPDLCKDTVPSRLFCAAVITGNTTLCMEPEVFDIGLGRVCWKRVCDANTKNKDVVCIIANLRH